MLPILYFDSMHLPMIERELFKLRPWQPDDAPALARHANNHNVARMLRDGFPFPYTLSDAGKWLEKVIDNESDMILAIAIDGEAVGGIGIFGGKDVYRFNGELGYWLSEAHWGRGIMTDAVANLVDYAFRETKWLRFFATVFQHNTASMRILEKCGFQHEAIHRKTVMKEGELLDEHLYALRKEQWEKRRKGQRGPV